MAHVGTAPRVRNIVLFGVGLAIAVLLGWLIYQSLPTERGISTVSPFGQLVFLVFGVIFGGALVLATALKKPEISRAAWTASKVGVTLLVLWWFVWGQGFGAIGGVDPTATPVNGLHRIAVPLKAGQWVAIDKFVPPCTRAKFEMDGVRNPLIRRGGGPPQPMGSGKDFPWQSPMELSGDGTAYIWLADPKKSC